MWIALGICCSKLGICCCPARNLLLIRSESVAVVSYKQLIQKRFQRSKTRLQNKKNKLKQAGLWVTGASKAMRTPPAPNRFATGAPLQEVPYAQPYGLRPPGRAPACNVFICQRPLAATETAGAHKRANRCRFATGQRPPQGRPKGGFAKSEGRAEQSIEPRVRGPFSAIRRTAEKAILPQQKRKRGLFTSAPKSAFPLQQAPREQRKHEPRPQKRRHRPRRRRTSRRTTT